MISEASTIPPKFRLQASKSEHKGSIAHSHRLNKKKKFRTSNIKPRYTCKREIITNDKSIARWNKSNSYLKESVRGEY